MSGKEIISLKKQQQQQNKTRERDEHTRSSACASCRTLLGVFVPEDS